ncbi:hypothetical protein ALP8811_00712 [Aliiroseovarius pelagivivens]|uniref:DUF5681 domain-containing protein n=1 Tax=Aliiroseovarius pelagivivens TaxID=1639690 RepID=A0A2R8AI70_9RHOB|nr:DUF5681 domain-containing protein [Aliiroseovarius pelagivivens]SPF75718.1 hypothetical protein ALP8811_00712 [Aliiroseovarius pelagivivens]
MSKDRDDYEIGYGKPPKSTRFKKGQSGNAKGRPKGSRNFATDLDEVLKAKMTVNENGKPRKVSAQQAALMRLREKALNGEIRALDRLLSMADERSADKEAQNKERHLSSDEVDILERFVNVHAVASSAEGQSDGE